VNAQRALDVAAELGGDPSGIAVPLGRASVITLTAESGANFLAPSSSFRHLIMEIYC
jgi:hypothetical protein